MDQRYIMEALLNQGIKRQAVPRVLRAAFQWENSQRALTNLPNRRQFAIGDASLILFSLGRFDRQLKPGLFPIGQVED